MATSTEQYRTSIEQQEEKIAHFLRTFEALQEKIHFVKIRQNKEELFDAVGDLFPPINAEFENLTPPSGMESFHQQWKEALEQLEDAYTSFLTGSESNFMTAYFQSRRAFSQGKYQLYGMRTQLPTLHKYWVLPEAVARLADLRNADQR